jgi:hypothetical protein
MWYANISSSLSKCNDPTQRRRGALSRPRLIQVVGENSRCIERDKSLKLPVVDFCHCFLRTCILYTL